MAGSSSIAHLQLLNLPGALPSVMSGVLPPRTIMISEALAGCGLSEYMSLLCNQSEVLDVGQNSAIKTWGGGVGKQAVA